MVLVIVMGCVLLFVVAATSLLWVGISEVRMVRRQNNSTKALYLAEAGVEFARAQLSDDWDDFDALSDSLGAGTYAADTYNTDSGGAALPSDERRVVSVGSVESVARTVEVIVKSIIFSSGASGVTSAIEVEGSIDIQGSADIEGTQVQGVVLSFEDVFGVTAAEMENIASTYYPATYYNATFSNDVAMGVTWVNTSPGEESQITQTGWLGGGILIVQGNMKITGGVFNGIIWVIGTLTISGNPTINGAIFVESGLSVDTTVTGNAQINYSSGDVDGAFYQLTSLPASIAQWREI